MTVRYHNKGSEMLQLPKILHRKSVRDTLPQFLSNRKPPRVSYSYTMKLVEELDFDGGTRIYSVTVLRVSAVMSLQDMLSQET